MSYLVMDIWQYCIRDCNVHRRWQRVNDRKSIQRTEAGIERITILPFEHELNY